MDNQEFKFVKIGDDEKKRILEDAGYFVNEDNLILDGKTHKPHICPFSGEQVFLHEASLLPGSLLVVKTTPLTIAEYISKYIQVE